MTAVAMDTVHIVRSRSPRAVWARRALSGVAILFLAIDAGGKLIVPDMMIANSPPLGLPSDPGLYRMVGGILAVCTALYAWPRRPSIVQIPARSLRFAATQPGKERRA